MCTGRELVDVHAHFVSDAYVAAAVAAGHARPDGMPAWPTWSVAEHLALMDAHGIERSILSVSSPGVHFGDDAAARDLAREMNRFGANVVAAHPDRFGQFAALPLPDVEGAIAEASHALDALGADGVTILSNSAGVYLGDPTFEPLLAELNRRAATVFVHPTAPPNWRSVALGRPAPMIEYLFDTARTVVDLLAAGRLEQFPDIRWIYTHGGGVLPLLADRIDLFQTHIAGGEPGDTQRRLGRLWFDCAGTPLPLQLPTLARVAGTERILYGSDYCFTPAPLVAAQVASLDADGWREVLVANTRAFATGRSSGTARYVAD